MLSRAQPSIVNLDFSLPGLAARFEAPLRWGGLSHPGRLAFGRSLRAPPDGLVRVSNAVPLVAESKYDFRELGTYLGYVG